MPKGEALSEQANIWFQKAKKDLAWSRYALEGGFFSQTCFGCQQAAEKALKAYLFWRKQELIRTHSLPQLLAKCMEFDEGFGVLGDACSVLTVYYIDTRYPGLGPSFGEDVATEAIELASEVLRLVGRKMERGADATH